MIKWIVCDMDNTLLTSDKTLTDQTRAVLAAFQAKGVAIGLATGRAYELAKPYAQALDITLPLIVNNGALIKTVQGDIVKAHHLSPETYRPFMHYANTHGYPVTFYGEEGFYSDDPERLAFYEAWNQQHPHAAVKVHPLKALNNNTQVYKMLMVIDAPSAMNETLKKYRNHPKVHITRSQHNFFDVLPHATSKGDALEVLLDKYNVLPGEIIVFGDEDNDVEMLAKSPYSYAMPNGSKRAKAAARHIALANHDAEGVAKTLHTWLERL